METFTLISILQLLTGNYPVPLNESCINIIEHEKNTGNEFNSINNNQFIMSLDRANKTRWIYTCKPKKWTLQVSEGSVDRSVAEEAYKLAYNSAIQFYGLPEIDTNILTNKQLKKIETELGSDYIQSTMPYAVWNINSENLARLRLEQVFYDKSKKDKWAVELSIETNKQAECGDFFQRQPCQKK